MKLRMEIWNSTRSRDAKSKNSPNSFKKSASPTKGQLALKPGALFAMSKQKAEENHGQGDGDIDLSIVAKSETFKKSEKAVPRHQRQNR